MSTDQNSVIRRGVSWAAVVCGWFVAVGVAALLTVVVSGQLGTIDLNASGSLAAVSPLLALLIAAFIGGHVAGRAAGFRTSWHGLQSGFFGLFVVMLYMLAQIAAQHGMLGLRYDSVPQLFPAVLTVALYHTDSALGLGLAMTVPAQLLAAWLGGLLAPGRSTSTIVRRPARVVRIDHALQPQL